MEKNKKLYNIIFPVWLLWLLPSLWLIIIPGNFLFDSLVVIVSMYALKIDSKKTFYKKHIFKIFLFGMLSDIIGALFMWTMVMVFETSALGDDWYVTIPGVLLSAGMIFLFNYFVTFRKLDKKERMKLSIIITAVTAPYAFFIPTSWIY